MRHQPDLPQPNPQPEDVAKAARTRRMGQRAYSSREAFAVVALVFGGYLLPVAGYLIGGLIWVLTPGWRTRVKVAGLLVWPLCTLALIATSAVTYWLVLPLGDPYSSIATSLFLLVPSSWFLVLLTAAWMLLVSRGRCQ
ncbi:hypothetical protein GCM10010211_71270 [Streptomyces albospinus]|uniref:Integral membrane protein n=2 Tax=Streptomyces albospinus TaxID=285515 RepID=A0ABQ2VMV6_9ACTN|nr:hypothetical protein GCM10010211_71270 [Streptomyces albospinus]